MKNDDHALATLLLYSIIDSIAFPYNFTFSLAALSAFIASRFDVSKTFIACAVISLDCFLYCSAYGVYVQLGNVVLADVTLLPLPNFFVLQKPCQQIVLSVVCILAVVLKLLLHILVGI